ncbi:hypothetical protein [Aeoliella sp. SH292]|uniref:hypothetical protein n=1 Tax=Aeoliella sp. SH292 TaxID=3454464 RepID=UPI003F9CDB36
MNRKHVFGAFVACLMLLSGAWAMGWFGGDDAEVAALIAEMQNQDDMTDEQRQAFRERMRSLDDGQRQMLFGSMMQARQAEMQSRVYALSAMPPAQRRAELDKWINDMESRRKQWEAGRGGRGAGLGGGGGGPPGGEMTSAERAQRGKSRLDRSTPEMRATMTQMMKMVNERREERGMEPIGRWR